MANSNRPSVNGGNGGETIEILYVNDMGGGFAGKKTIPAGTTVGEFFDDIVGLHVDSDTRRITVNNHIVEYERELQAGDELTVAPIQVKGAA